MILHIHMKLTDKLNLVIVANSFVAGNEHRLSIFSKFDPTDI